MDAISKVGGNNAQMMQKMMEAQHAEPAKGAASSENVSKAASTENTQEAAPADGVSAPDKAEAPAPEIPQVESCNMSEEAMGTGANEESGANMAELLQGMQK